MSKREQVLNALDALCKEEYSRGWNEARDIYNNEKALSERERMGYNRGYDLGHTDGYFKGRATMRTRIEDIILELKEEE